MRNLKKICKKFTEAEIYFHQDLDGVASALLMREHLKRYGVKTADAHCIQYGDREWSIPTPKEGRMYVLVDFAHGKTMFHVHTDHHDRQVGVATKCTTFKSARSNAETLDNIPHQYFPSLDLEIIRTVDSANYLEHNIHPHQIRNFVINDKLSEDAEQNRWLLGLACNKLLLTYKNRLSFLKLIVLNATPSLLSIYIHALKLREKFGFPSLEQTQIHSDLYRNRMKKYPELRYDARNKIIKQMGGGMMFDPGSYDRYIVFENHPLSEFLIMIWPMGLLQVSCNPFKEQRLKNINLGDIADEILENHKATFQDIFINLHDIKFENEKRIAKERKKARRKGYAPKERIGFHTNDLLAIYGDCLFIEKNVGEPIIKYDKEIHTNFINMIRPILDTREYELQQYQRNILKRVHINMYDLIRKNSGGHASITNLSAFNYLDWNQTKMKQHFQTGSFVTVMHILADEAYLKLRDKIKESKELEKNEVGDYWSLYTV